MDAVKVSRTSPRLEKKSTDRSKLLKKEGLYLEAVNAISSSSGF